MNTQPIKTLSILLFAFVFLNSDLNAQCFGPQDGSTIYINCDPAIGDFSTALVGLTNRDPAGTGIAGDWVIDATTPAGIASFAPDPNNPASLLDDGSSASLIITGPGSITLTNTIFDASDPLNPNPETCTQTYTVECYQSDIVDNPDVSDICPTKILLVLDESGSIDVNASGLIESAVMTLVNQLISLNAEAELAIVEYESRARMVPINGNTSFQTVDATLATGVNTYLTSPSALGLLATGQSDPRDPASYTPGENVDLFVGGTNWEDGFMVASGYGADLVLFLTDGLPTYYLDPISSEGVSGEGNVLDMTALTRAQAAANTLKSNSNTHLLVLGVGAGVTAQPIVEVSGSDTYNLGDTIDQFCIGDFSITDFPDLTTCLEDVANQIASKQNCLEPIPTMGEWGLICLSLLFMIFGIVRIKEENKELTIVKA